MRSEEEKKSEIRMRSMSFCVNKDNDSDSILMHPE